MSQKLLKYFLKLGATGFGGPLALIQQMRSDLVESERLIDFKEFDQAFTLIKAMPGPVAFQVAVYCGHRLLGFRGALIAAFGLIFPAFLMMILIGIFYSKISVYPQIKFYLTGMQYAVAAIILLGLKNFIVSYKNNILFWLITIASAHLYVNKIIPESILIIGFGVFVVALKSINSKHKTQLLSATGISFLYFFDEKIIKIFKTCFMAGALVFGTGLALFPFLQSEFVEHLSWLPLAVFNDGVTFGQMTPGPVTISTTFFGYQMAGLQGALAATLGLLIPPFFHMTTWFPRATDWMSKQKWISFFILGSTAAVVGCLFMTVYKMNSNELSSPYFWIIFIPAVAMLYFKPKVSIFKLLIAAGAVHLLINLVAGFVP